MVVTGQKSGYYQVDASVNITANGYSEVLLDMRKLSDTTSVATVKLLTNIASGRVLFKADGKVVVDTTFSNNSLLLELPMNSYVVEVVKEGYEVFRNMVTITSDMTIQANLVQLPSSYGLVSVITHPEQAVVTFINSDNQTVGILTSNGFITLPKGVYIAKLEKTGYQSDAVQFNLADYQEVDFTLLPVSNNKAYFLPLSLPTAYVYLDGELIGESNTTYELAAGNHGYWLIKQGYEVIGDVFSVQAGETYVSSNQLVSSVIPSTSAIVQVLTQPDDAEIFLDFQKVGEGYAKVEVKGDDNHNVLVKRNGYVTFSQTFYTEAGKSYPLYVDLTKEPVTKPSQQYIYIGSIPSGANAYIDGVLVGETPELDFIKVKVEAGNHFVFLQKENYEFYTEEVYVPEGGRQYVFANMIGDTPAQQVNPTLSLTVDGERSVSVNYGDELNFHLTGQNGDYFIFEGSQYYSQDETIITSADHQPGVYWYKAYNISATGFAVDSVKVTVKENNTPTTLTVNSIPSGASATIDTQFVGYTDWTGEVDPGNRLIALQKAGYFTDMTVLYVNEGRHNEITRYLQKIPADTISIDIPWCKLIVDADDGKPNSLRKVTWPGYELTIHSKNAVSGTITFFYADRTIETINLTADDLSDVYYKNGISIEQATAILVKVESKDGIKAFSGSIIDRKGRIMNIYP